MSASTSSEFVEVPDPLWERVEPLLTEYPVSPQGGCPRLPMRKVIADILYVLRIGC